MIKYKFEEEYQFAIYYAKKLKDNKAIEILERGEVMNSEEATYLSEFFWKIVDSSIEDEKMNVELPWVEGGEFWSEKIMNSLSGYLERSGYEKEWDSVVDKS